MNIPALATGEQALRCGEMSNGNFIKDEYTHTLRLESELSDLRVGYANPYRAR